MNILDRIDAAQQRQDFRMCVPPEPDDTDIVLSDCKAEIKSLRQQLAAAHDKNKELIFSLQACRSNNRDLRNELAAALAACEAKDEKIVYALAHISLHRPECDPLNEALAIKPDVSALKAHDDALIEQLRVALNPNVHLWDSAIRELKGK